MHTLRSSRELVLESTCSLTPGANLIPPLHSRPCPGESCLLPGYDTRVLLKSGEGLFVPPPPPPPPPPPGRRGEWARFSRLGRPVSRSSQHPPPHPSCLVPRPAPA